jgi:hypothetical protein
MIRGRHRTWKTKVSSLWQSSAKDDSATYNAAPFTKLTLPSSTDFQYVLYSKRASMPHPVQRFASRDGSTWPPQKIRSLAAPVSPFNRSSPSRSGGPESFGEPPLFLLFAAARRDRDLRQEREGGFVRECPFALGNRKIPDSRL